MTRLEARPMTRSPRAAAARDVGRVRTLPEQIADDLGAAIARGDFAADHPLREQDIADRFGVSRGPVREALRILAQRGLAIIYPRRGARVVEVTLDGLVDLFNIRAVVMGLAARYFAVMAADEARARLDEALAELERVAYFEGTDAATFLRATTRVGLTISRGCGSESLSQLIAHQNQGSAWSSLWQSGRLDFLTRERRLSACADYQAMGAAIRRRDGAGAEAVMRRMIMLSRESAVAALAKARGQSFDARRLLSA
jgi:DNA-binding GntR family transcriptional regulator